MNAGFRNLLGRRDTTKFKAFLLAIFVQMLVLPLLISMGLVKFQAPDFFPVGAVVGGLFFGLAMNWGGGCASGLWYKLGSGSIGAFISLLSLTFGYVMAESGILKPIRLFIQSVHAPNSTLTGVLNIPAGHWIGSLIAAVFLFILLKDWRLQDSQWRTTGITVGAVAVLAWITSSWAGRPFGMAIMPGTKDAFDVLSNGKWHAFSWDFFFVAGIPIGGYFSANRSGEFKWSNIAGASIWKNVGGGLVLGISASLAAGCTVGHGLTGVPLLSTASIVFVLAAIAGAWSGVLFPEKLNRIKQQVIQTPRQTV